MKEIKFRVFKTFGLTGMKMDYNPVIYKGMYCDMDGSLICDTYEGDFAILMQYTGLKDRWGNEIYEGDILEEPTTDPETEEKEPYRKFLVVWDEKSAGFKFKCLLFSDSELWETKYLDYAKVIGNMYENPELLKMEEK